MRPDVADAACRDTRLSEIQRATEHLSLRIDAALHDPTVSLDKFMGLVQQYTQNLFKMKAYRTGRSLPEA